MKTLFPENQIVCCDCLDGMARLAGVPRAIVVARGPEAA